MTDDRATAADESAADGTATDRGTSAGRAIPAGEAVAPAYEVPDGEKPAARCPYCDRPFAAERLRDLHVGEVHADAWTDDEREAYEAARREETDDLFVFHLKVVGALVLLFFAFMYTYAIVLS